MATTSLTMDPPLPIGRRVIIGAVSLIGILLGSSIIFFFSYWFGTIFLSFALFFFFLFLLKRSEGRNLSLLLTVCLFVGLIVGGVALVSMADNPQTPEFIRGSTDRLILTAIVTGIAAAMLLVIAPFLIIVAIITDSFLKWHQHDDLLSFLTAYWYILTDLLGVFYFSVIVDLPNDNDDGIKDGYIGKEPDIFRLKTYGGPGKLSVFPGQVVVLHTRGKITRVIGEGITMLGRAEQVRRILPLANQGGLATLENVLTKDKIPLTVNVVHVVQLEPYKDTIARGETISSGDPLVGDEYDKCYASIARKAAMKAPNIWDSLKTTVASNLRDVIMTCDFDELFNAGEEADDTGAIINPDQRKIAEIEKMVKEKAAGSGPGKGVILRLVDIIDIHFPEGIKDKIIDEATELTERKMRQLAAEAREKTTRIDAKILKIETESRTEANEIEAKSEITAAEYRSKAIQQLAWANAKAEGLKDRIKFKAKTEHFEDILNLLRNNNIPDETTREVLKSLASSESIKGELKEMLELMTHYVHGQHSGNALADGNSDSRQL